MEMIRAKLTANRRLVVDFALPEGYDTINFTAQLMDRDGDAQTSITLTRVRPADRLERWTGQMSQALPPGNWILGPIEAQSRSLP